MTQNKITLPWERQSAWSRVKRVRRRWLVVAIVIGVLGFSFVRYAIHRTAVTQTRVTIDLTRRATLNFLRDVGRCPRSTLELVHPPELAGKYLDRIPRDAWNRQLRVRCPGRSQQVDVISAGPSGSFLTNDNVQ